MIMTSDSGSLNAECELGSSICTLSGGLNCVVSMKNVSRRKATSTMGVMSILMPTRGFFFTGIWFHLEMRCERLFVSQSQRLDNGVAGFIDHVGEAVDLVGEEIVG